MVISVPAVGRILGAACARRARESESDGARFREARIACAIYVAHPALALCAMPNAASAPRRYRIALHRAAGGYVGVVVDLPGCLARGASEVEAVERARAAIRAYLDTLDSLASGAALVELEIAP
jgi:predicted RNase H-like HicB family nuclease